LDYFMLIDLQLHSTYSDGYLTPTELVKFIASKGVKVASLTDHNTVGGLDEFRQACRKYKIKPIVGLELYVKMGAKRFNLLWYNFDDKNPYLHEILRASQARRKNQVRLILKKLVKRGFKIKVDKILDKYNHYVPINHIANEIYFLPASHRPIQLPFISRTAASSFSAFFPIAVKPQSRLYIRRRSTLHALRNSSSEMSPPRDEW